MSESERVCVRVEVYMSETQRESDKFVFARETSNTSAARLALLRLYLRERGTSHATAARLAAEESLEVARSLPRKSLN